MPQQVLVELCVDGVESALAAAEGGAQRLELCTGLVEGGTTPSAGTLELVLERVRIPVVVLVRPRRGDFLYSSAEVEGMLRDVAAAKRAGARGVALGALRADGTLDVSALTELVRLARPLQITCHRAFDFARDPLEALEVLAGLGVERVLTSGGAPTALAGAERLAQLVRAAGAGGPSILAGGGVRAHNVRELVERCGVREVHATARELAPSGMRHRPAGLTLDSAAPGAWEQLATRRALVRALVEATSAP